MAYTKNTWKTGDIVSSQKLNHMEDGIANAYEVMVINIVQEDPAQSAQNLLRSIPVDYLDKTWQQIFDALTAGKACAIKNTAETFAKMDFVVNAFVDDDDGSYQVITTQSTAYKASSADKYPSMA